MAAVAAISGVLIPLLAGVGAAGSAAMQGYQLSQQGEQQKKAQAEADRQRMEQDKLIKESEARQAGKDAEANALAQAQEAATQSRQKQRAKAYASGGRQGTILTSPLGVTGESSTAGVSSAAGKTVLGG